MLQQAQDEQMDALARRDAPPTLRDALAAVAGRISIAEYAELMKKLLGERAWLLARIADEAGLANERAAPGDRAGVAPDASAGALVAACCADAAFDGPSLRAAARALAKGEKENETRSELMLLWLDAADERPARLDDYRAVFFTEQGKSAQEARRQGGAQGDARHRCDPAHRERAAGRRPREHPRGRAGRAHGRAAAARPRHRRTLCARPSAGAARSTTTT